MGTPHSTFNPCTVFSSDIFKLKMKCFAIFFAIIATAAAEAESEPWLGYGYGGYGGLGLGYGGAGLGISGLGLGYGAGIAGGYGYAAPAVAAAALPIAAAAPAAYAVAAPAAAVSTASLRAVPGAPTASQFRKGDEYGNQAFGYNNPNSARSESGNYNPPVSVSGSYTNKATGATINYIADEAGFRVVPGRKRRSAGVPGVRYEIKYNPGYAHGYFVIPALGY